MTLISASLLVVLLSISTVDEGLEMLREGKPVDRVPRAVGIAAAERLPKANDTDEIRHLALLARKGGAYKELAASLLPYLSQARGGPRTEAALAELNQLPKVTKDEAVAKLTPEQIAKLKNLLAWEMETNAKLGLLAILAPVLDAPAFGQLLRAWNDDEGQQALAAALIEALPQSRHAPACFQAMLGQELAPALVPAATTASRALVTARPEIADKVLGLVQGGDHGQGAFLVRALGGLPLADDVRWAKAEAILKPVLEEATDPYAVDPPLLAAAMVAAGDLLIPELVPVARLQARYGTTVELRVTAVQAMARVCYRDLPTINLLIELLGDPKPEVAAAAYEALKFKSGQKRIPARPEQWIQWRESANLPQEPPALDAERLAEERLNRSGRRKKPKDE